MMLPSNLLLTHFHEQLSLLRHCPPPLPTLLNHSEDKNGNECLRQNSCYKSNLTWTISLYSSTKIVWLDLENEKKSQELDSMNLMGPFPIWDILWLRVEKNRHFLISTALHSRDSAMPLQAVHTIGNSNSDISVSKLMFVKLRDPYKHDVGVKQGVVLKQKL